MALELKLINGTWFVSDDGRVVAELFLDYLDQIDEIVLSAYASKAMQLEVLRLAASHVQQFVRNRTHVVSAGFAQAKYKDDSLTPADSRRLMDFRLIPDDVRELDWNTIIEQLSALSIDVTFAAYFWHQEALSVALDQINGVKIHCDLLPTKGRVFPNRQITLRFRVTKPDYFIFWRNGSGECHKDALYVMPSYHPAMKGGWESVGMVNGDTDAYIRGKAIRNLYCPRAARSLRRGNILTSSWTHVKHPFAAVGRSVDMRISTTQIRSQEGVNELVTMLSAALGRNMQYVEISGGFNAPMKYPSNRLSELDRKSPWPHAAVGHHLARGSEAHCVWAHRTLQKEGVLESSFVPPWFISEGWLDIYKDAEVSPGLH